MVILSGYAPRNVMLSADRISLTVLSPAISYCQGPPAGSNPELNRGLSELVSSQNVDRLTVDFKFAQLPANFELEATRRSPRGFYECGSLYRCARFCLVRCPMSSTCGMFFTFYDTITRHASDFVM